MPIIWRLCVSIYKRRLAYRSLDVHALRQPKILTEINTGILVHFSVAPPMEYQFKYLTYIVILFLLELHMHFWIPGCFFDNFLIPVSSAPAYRRLQISNRSGMESRCSSRYPGGRQCPRSQHSQNTGKVSCGGYQVFSWLEYLLVVYSRFIAWSEYENFKTSLQYWMKQRVSLYFFPRIKRSPNIQPHLYMY